MGDASVPTPLRTTPAPTTVTIRPKNPTVESRKGRPYYTRFSLHGREAPIGALRGRVMATTSDRSGSSRP